MTPKKLNDAFAYPPRGMSREEAARYIGVGTTKFDELVATRRMPQARRIDGRVVWDRYALDIAFNDLPENDGKTGLEALLEKSRKEHAAKNAAPDTYLDTSPKAVAARTAKSRAEQKRTGDRNYWRDHD